MAVVRLKRRCNEEPLDIVLLACKKVKTGDSVPETSVFKFAATVSNQEDASLRFTHPFKSDAENIVRKESRKLEEIQKKLRDDHELLAKLSRYKVVNCYRSLNEDDLKDEAEYVDKKGLTVLDIESHESKENVASQPVSNSESKYVYDLYYTSDNPDLDDLQLEHVHSVHPLGSDLVFDSYRDHLDSDDNFEDEDDSNDENNWRNDYPDEDDLASDEGDEDKKQLASMFFNLRLGEDERDDSSTEDEDCIYDGNLNPDDINNFGESYAKYKAKFNRSEYDSSCSVYSTDSS